MTPLLRDLPPDERARLTSVIWAAQDPRSPTCDYCGKFRRRDAIGLQQCLCETRRLASRPQPQPEEAT